MARHAQAFETSELLRVIRLFNHAAGEARLSWQPALPLEMALVEAIAQPEAPQPHPTQVEGPAPAAPRTSHSEAPPSAASSTSPPDTRGSAPGPAKEAEPMEDQTPAAPQASPEDQRATSDLEELWPRLLNMVRAHNPNTYGLLNSCKSRYFQGENLILNFASDVLKDKMEKPENIEAALAAAQELFKRELTVCCYVDTAKRDTLPPGVEDDGMVATALRDLGGEIVDIQ
jgi:DNA polymerase III gamma/tau subunit